MKRQQTNGQRFEVVATYADGVEYIADTLDTMTAANRTMGKLAQRNKVMVLTGEAIRWTVRVAV